MSNDNRTPQQFLNDLSKLAPGAVPIIGDQTAESLKAQFCKAQGHTPETIELATEQVKQEHNGLILVAFEDGEILKYDALPGKPGVYALLARETNDGRTSTIKHVGSARGKDVAQMIVDGVNLLFASQEAAQQIELDKKAIDLKATFEKMQAEAEKNAGSEKPPRD